jgi:bifunctional non-homologous end joining protein LigD
MFAGSEDLRNLPLTERKKRLKSILPKHQLIAYSEHRKQLGSKFFGEAEDRGLEGIMAKRSGAIRESW